jgi:hypothetical protein
MLLAVVLIAYLAIEFRAINTINFTDYRNLIE